MLAPPLGPKSASVPLLRIVPLVNEFSPVRINWPVPDLINEPAPVNTPFHVSVVPPLVTSMLALLLIVAAFLGWTAKPAWIVIGHAALFYPLALGLGPFDPYAIGYQPWPLLLACSGLAAALWHCRRNDWLLILAVALAAYAGGLFANLWDALVDPLLALAALAATFTVCHLTSRAALGIGVGLAILAVAELL